MIEEDIRAMLAPLVQGHVHPLRRPQNEGVPVIVYTFVGDDWMSANTLCGPGLHDIRVQIDCYANSYRDARSLAYSVAQLMDAIGTRLSMLPFPDDDEKIYRWLLEFSCWRNDRPEDIPAWEVPT